MLLHLRALLTYTAMFQPLARSMHVYQWHSALQTCSSVACIVSAFSTGSQQFERGGGDVVSLRARPDSRMTGLRAAHSAGDVHAAIHVGSDCPEYSSE